MENTTRHRPENTARDRGTVKKLREMFNVTQEELAYNARISGSQLSLWESGFVDFTEKELQLLGKAVNAMSKAKENIGMPGIVELQNGTYLEKCARWNKKLEIRARRSLRRQVHLTIIGLAEKIGIPEKKLREWEKGRIELTGEESEKWIRALTTAQVQQKKADPWWRLEQAHKAIAELVAERSRYVSRLESMTSVDDPIVSELIESFRRQIAQFEEQAAEPATEPEPALSVLLFAKMLGGQQITEEEFSQARDLIENAQKLKGE